jgi:ATP-dependent RNA helicase HelY
LKSEGFVNEENRLTEDGIWASKLRLDQPVLIAECLRREALPLESEALLAAVIAPFVYDRGQEISVTRKFLPKKFIRASDEIFACIRPMTEKMEAAGFPVAPLPLWPAVVIYEWACGRDWDEVIEERGIADGDMAMLVSRTADNLRQIASLRDTHPRVAELASKARVAILREPIVFE